MNRYTGLGFDPAPGTVDSVRALAERLAEAGRAMDDAAGRYAAAVAASDAWHGDAAERFRRHGTTLPERLRTQQETVASAAEVLFGWAGTLADLQRQAEQYDRRARGLAVRIADAEQLVEEWVTAVSVASTHVRPQAEATLAIHQDALARLRSELDGVRTAARALAAEHRRAATDTAARLRRPTAAVAPRPALVTEIGALMADLATHARRATAIAGLARPPGVPSVPAGALGIAVAALGT